MPIKQPTDTTTYTMNDKQIIALEVGSSVIKIGDATISHNDNGEQSLTINAVEKVFLSDAVRYGRVQNVDATTEALTTLIDKIQMRPGFAPAKIKALYVSVGGRSLATVKTSVRLTMPNEDATITREIINRLEDEACRQVSDKRQVLEVIPLRYFVDNLPTDKPIGMIGTKIAADYTIVVCDGRNLQNIETVVNKRMGLDIAAWTVRPIAIGNVCLAIEQTRLGCMLVDIGAETTTVAIYKVGKLQYIATIPLGSRHITNDLAMQLGITTEDAEDLKHRLGNALSTDTANASVEQTKIDRYVQSRATEIVGNVLAHIGFAGYKKSDLSAGIILTGQGSKLKNIGKLFENMSCMTVRKATIQRQIDISDASVVESDEVDIISTLVAAVPLAESDNATECVEVPEPEHIEPKKVDSKETHNDEGFHIEDNDDDDDDLDDDLLSDDDDDFDEEKRRAAERERLRRAEKEKEKEEKKKKRGNSRLKNRINKLKERVVDFIGGEEDSNLDDEF